MKKLCFWILILAHIEINAIIILVHGTFATGSKWWQPGGDFYQALEQEATKINEKIHLLNWTGALNNSARIKAAKNLAELVLSLKTVNNEKIIIIGHSFGGNVINLASKLLYHSENIPSFYSFEDTAEFVQSYRDLAKLRAKRCCKNLIEVVYLLGTPIDLDQFHPNMYVIKYLCNLFSPNDKVQSVLGFYGKKVENLERIANFEIIIRDAQVATGYPNHIQMHHPIIAQSLLYIPFSLKEQKVGGFELFDWNECGMIELADEKPPLYIVTQKSERPEQTIKDPEISHISLWS